MKVYMLQELKRNVMLKPVDTITFITLSKMAERSKYIRRFGERVFTINKRMWDKIGKHYEIC